METTVNPRERYDLPKGPLMPAEPPDCEQAYRWGTQFDGMTNPQAKPSVPARGVSFLGGWLSFVGELTRR